MLKRRMLVWSLVLLAVAAAIGWSFRPAAPDVEVASAVKAPMEVTLDQEGRTHIEDRYVVSAPMTGYARRIALKAGDDVKAGSALVILEPQVTEGLDPRSEAEARADVTRAAAALRSAEAERQARDADSARARQREQRMRTASGAGAVTRDDVDAAAADLRKAEAEARAAAFRAELARAELEAARARVTVGAGSRSTAAPVVVHSPVDACILKVDHESEGLVHAGDPLLELGCRASLVIRADVLSRDSLNLKPGQPARIEDWGGTEALDAVVQRVEPQAFTKVSALGVEEQRVWVILDVRSGRAAWAQLGDDYRVMVRFLLWHTDSVLQVPASAVYESNGRQAVLVVAHGRLEERTLSVGHRTPVAAEVTSGLVEGETVVAHPRRELQAGMRVTAVPAR